MKRATMLVLPLALGAAAVPALPCSIVAPVPGAAISSDVAVAGTVTGVDRPGLVDGSVARTFTFRVDTVLRGSPGATVKVQTGANSAMCGSEFTVGGRYLLFASRTEGDGGAFTKGALFTGLASGNRDLTRTERVTEDDLYVPAPEGFDARRSNLTPREFVAFAPFSAYWLGGVGPSGNLRAIREQDGAVIVTYRQGGAAPLRVVTRRVCLTDGPVSPRLTGIRRVRGVPAGFRQGGVSVFTGNVEVRITGRTPAVRLRAAQALFTGGAQTFGTDLPAPEARPVSRLAPCGVR
jgi:hypothetical protein